MQLFSNSSSTATREGKKVITVCESKVTSFLAYFAGFVVLAAVLVIILLVILQIFPLFNLFAAVPPLFLAIILLYVANKRTRQGGHFVIDGEKRTLIQKHKERVREWSFEAVRSIDTILDITDGMRPPHFVFWLRVTISDTTKLDIAKGIKSEVVLLQNALQEIGLGGK